MDQHTQFRNAEAIPTIAERRDGNGRASAAERDCGVDLNAADLDELMGLPGIGRAEAEDILRYRAVRGAFRSVDELRYVGGLSAESLRLAAQRLRVAVQDL
ncbi:MAG TPA: helix-hairpin-helix domain-containing protein [Azospirillaceae bacterium]|nr:helix-hairpin-helix domain-containing protein [Azospirillaceae bacterium]